MEKQYAVKYMQVFAKARAKGAKAITEFNTDMEAVLKRLIYEGVANYMSAEMIAEQTGLTSKKIRTVMRHVGLSPALGKRTLADNAAKALATNAELLGIKPWQMDLMTPLAYLPMGSKMREALVEQGVHRVSGNAETAWEEFAKANDYNHPDEYDYTEQRRFWVMGYEAALS